MPYTAPAVNNK